MLEDCETTLSAYVIIFCEVARFSFGTRILWQSENLNTRSKIIYLIISKQMIVTT